MSYRKWASITSSALVRQGGRIYRDLDAHVPSGVAKSLARCHGLQLLAAQPAERPPRGGEHHPGHRGHVVPLQALEDRRVLAVDGDQLTATGAGSLHDQLAARHQRFLVGQSQSLARPEGGERGFQPHGSHDGVHHNVDVGVGGKCQQLVRAGPPVRTGKIRLPRQAGRVRDHGARDPMLGHLIGRVRRSIDERPARPRRSGQGDARSPIAWHGRWSPWSRESRRVSQPVLKRD